MKKKSFYHFLIYFAALLVLSIYAILFTANFYNNIKPTIAQKTVHSNNLNFPKLCKNFKDSDFTFSNNVSNSKIAIVISIERENNLDEYIIAINSTKCYASHFGYQYYLINATDKPHYRTACRHPDFFFQRHCILSIFMEENLELIDYILFIDADMGIINPCHTIQNYIDPNVDMMFYERYFNYEFAAGSFIIRNTKFSRDFLNFWADYNFKLPDSFHGTDNGAIHQVLMELHFQDPKDQHQCFHLWEASKDYDGLFAYEACTKHALYRNSTLFVKNKIKIIQKMGHRWVRDGWLTNTRWSSKDFMLHGWKRSLTLENFMYPFLGAFDLSKCHFGDAAFSNFKYIPNLMASDEEIDNFLLTKTLFIHAKYNNLLKFLNITCNDGSEKSPDGKCRF